MRPKIIVIFLILLFSFPVWGAPAANSRIALREISLQTNIPSPIPLYPVAVRPASVTTLKDLSISQVATQKVLETERASYKEIQSSLKNAPAAEQTVLRDSLSEQRQRFLISVLNSLTLVYQRSDLLLQKLDSGTTRLRAFYLSSNNSLEQFDTRHTKLVSNLTILKQESRSIEAELTACSANTVLADCIQSSRDSIQALISGMRSFMVSYKSLATDVVQARTLVR